MEPLETNDTGIAPGGPDVDGAAVRQPVSADLQRSFWFDIQVWMRDVVFSVAIAAVVIIFLYQPVKVEGTSMMPWLEDQERIFVNKFVYRFEEITRGDIIVFRFPLDQSKSYIKRVVGLPGDIVEVVQGELIVNGQPVLEPYLLPEFRDHASYSPVTVPPEEYYVLGDHRNTSNDSRTWGTVERQYITGKAVFAYWPLERFGVLQ